MGRFGESYLWGLKRLCSCYFLLRSTGNTYALQVACKPILLSLSNSSAHVVSCVWRLPAIYRIIWR